MKKILVLSIIMVLAFGIGALLRAEDASLFTTEKPEAEEDTTVSNNTTSGVATGEAYQVESEEPAYVIPENNTTITK